MSGWGWLLLILVLVVLAYLIWRWWQRGRTPVAAPKTEAPKIEMVAEAAKVEPVVVPSAPVPPPQPAADDLIIIEGIGPKVASVLQSVGITTFAQLAATDVSRLQEILRDAGLPYLDPGTWPEQARLAAAGKLDDLKKLQETLKGGRRT